MKSWYLFTNKVAGVLDISLHAEIGAYGVSAASFIRDLKAQPDAKVINLSIHSPGGELLDGIAMYHALRDHSAKVYGSVAGLAASAASIVLMGADTISMPENTFLMIHNPWTVAIGDASEMRKVADVAQMMQGSMISIYEQRTGIDATTIAEMMAEESWIPAADAMELGFIDNISEPVKLAAKLGGFEKHFKSLPEGIDDGMIRIDALESITDLETYLREAGEFSRNAAKALVARSKKLIEREAQSDDEDETALLEALNRIKVPASLSGAE